MNWNLTWLQISSNRVQQAASQQQRDHASNPRQVMLGRLRQAWASMGTAIANQVEGFNRRHGEDNWI